MQMDSHCLYCPNIIDCRFPFVCVSIGLTIGKIPTVGVVYNPIIDEVTIPVFTNVN